jgi:hypothetical protein
MRKYFWKYKLIFIMRKVLFNHISFTKLNGGFVSEVCQAVAQTFIGIL